MTEKKLTRDSFNYVSVDDRYIERRGSYKSSEVVPGYEVPIPITPAEERLLELNKTPEKENDANLRSDPTDA